MTGAEHENLGGVRLEALAHGFVVRGVLNGGLVTVLSGDLARIKRPNSDLPGRRQRSGCADPKHGPQTGSADRGSALDHFLITFAEAGGGGRA